jgi:pimeloyl-ACP methyl ester carboxylesterase
MEAGLRVHEGGSGEPLLVLLHGLGATGDVWGGWRPLLARRWPGRWLAPDLPGHGGSPPLAAYTFDGFAGAVASIVRPGARTIVLGHSLGGVVGLALASGRFPVQVHAVIGLGVKVVWTDEDLERAQALARRPRAWFASRDEAAARYLRVSGLAGLLPAGDAVVDAGLRDDDGQWRLAMDPGAFAVGAPDMAQLIARSQALVTLARGELDAMNTDEQLTRLGPPTVTLPGLGHNAHVESPELSITLLDAYR